MILCHQETIKFDASNKEHRDAVRCFMKRFAWADSPIRFAPSPVYSNLVHEIREEMLQWYMAQEDPALAKSNKPSDLIMLASRAKKSA
jgi:hypothetical protein